MAKPLRLSPITAALLSLAAGALRGVDPDPGTDGPVDLVIGGVSDAVGALADAGSADSDDGRTVTVRETRAILEALVADLERAAALIPADLVTVPVPVWTYAVLAGVGALLARADGVVGVIASALQALAAATRDGVVDAAELVTVIATIRAAADAARSDLA